MTHFFQPVSTIVIPLRDNVTGGCNVIDQKTATAAGWGQWIVIRPITKDDDGQSQRPAILPSFPRNPRNGSAAAVLACQQQISKEAARC